LEIKRVIKDDGEHDDGVQVGGEVAEEGVAVDEDVERHGRVLDVLALDDDEGDHADDTDDERDKDLVGGPRVLAAAPGEAEHGRRRGGDEENVPVVHLVELLLHRRLGRLDLEEEDGEGEGDAAEGEVHCEQGGSRSASTPPPSPSFGAAQGSMTYSRRDNAKLLQ